MHLRIERGDQPPETMTVPADVAFVSEDGAWVEDVRPLVTRVSTLTPMQLTRLLHASYFSASDDVEADSYDTQSARFNQDATHLAIKLLATEDEARKHTIAEAVWRDILWVMPRDREVSIKVSGGKVAVEFGPESPRARGSGGMTWYTMQASYAAYYGNTVSVEAETLEEALEKAIEAANDDPHWKSLDHCGPTYVDACCIGRDADPWERETTLPVPRPLHREGRTAARHLDRSSHARRN